MENLDRYSRQTMLPEIGTDGQMKLIKAKVLIIGVGGLGSAAALYLTGAGIGTLGLVDKDVVSLSNLQRQVLYTENAIGEPKVSAASRRLEAMSSATHIVTYNTYLDPKNAKSIISGYDIVIDCCDNYTTRYLINDTCLSLGTPWIYGSIGAFNGQVALFNFKSGAQYTDLYPDRKTLCSLPRTSGGVIGTMPGVIGTLQASEAIKLIAGFGKSLDGRLFTINLKTLETQIIDL